MFQWTMVQIMKLYHKTESVALQFFNINVEYNINKLHLYRIAYDIYSCLFVYVCMAKHPGI